MNANERRLIAATVAELREIGSAMGRALEVLQLGLETANQVLARAESLLNEEKS